MVIGFMLIGMNTFSDDYVIWTSTYNSPNNRCDIGNSVAVDGSGNVYVTGYENRADLGQSNNIWTRKYDSNGYEVWTSTYNSPSNNNDSGNGIAVDTTGNVYVTGYENRTDLVQSYNIWTRKYDSNGYKIWTSTYDSPNNGLDKATGIAVDSSGNVYITGFEYRSDLGQGFNIWTRKYNSTGYKVWTSTYNSAGNKNDKGSDIAVDASGNVYVTGYEDNGTTFENNNIWVRKYDNNGYEVWTSTYSSPGNNDDEGNGIAVDGSGNVYVVGYIDRSDLSQALNVWIRKYNSDGYEIWTLTYNSAGNKEDKGSDIAVDDSGNVYVTGYIDRSDLVQGDNILIKVYDKNGNEIWSSTYNSPANQDDRGYDIAVDADCNFYVTGFVNRASDLNQGYNIWTRKYKALSLTAKDLEGVIVYPNPVNVNDVAFVNFKDLTENSNIKIYTIAGDLVFEKNINTGSYQWNIQNNNDKNIKSGVYIYLITNDTGEKKIGKFAIIR